MLMHDQHGSDDASQTLGTFFYSVRVGQGSVVHIPNRGMTTHHCQYGRSVATYKSREVFALFRAVVDIFIEIA